jgi:hypothetical protein
MPPEGRVLQVFTDAGGSVMDHENPQDKAASKLEWSKPLSDIAKRALAEAEARRLAASGKVDLPREINGRDGPEPVRFGDWEVKGLASDF